MNNQILLSSKHTTEDYKELGGGKALNLHKMFINNVPVPEFITISNTFFDSYKQRVDLVSILNNINDPEKDSGNIQKVFLDNPLSQNERQLIIEALKESNLEENYFAVRSSGLDEDSKEHSFAGMFSSFLFQKTIDQIDLAIRECWASAFSPRCLGYRIENGLSTQDIGMGVVIQKMINSQVSGVMFTRNPINQADRSSVLIESLYGQCEGLVCGELEADSYKVNRNDFEVEQTLAKKTEQYISNKDTAGIQKVSVSTDKEDLSSLSKSQTLQVAKIGIQLEKTYQMPLDIEWTIENEKLYIVQMRPITSLPSLAFYNPQENGDEAILWDNSNIVESFAGVTTPLTFSLTKEAYEIVYRQTCIMMGVPKEIIENYSNAFKNMLGFVRGRVYYNLINWYKLLFLIPGSSSNQGFMETMLGVKDELDEKQQKVFNFVDQVPRYGSFKKINLMFKLGFKFLRIKSIVRNFSIEFNNIYQEYLSFDFTKMSLRELKDSYERWNNKITYNWNAPIINDFLVMVFFGTLKKLTEKWVKTEENIANLQNDLLCGQGEIDSTLPTISLMKLAKKYDSTPELRSIFMDNELEDIKALISKNKIVQDDINEYLHLYGFRCNNEQKLEEDDLHTDPTFIFDALKNYIRMKNYDIKSMHENELKIKNNAQAKVDQNISGIKRVIFMWVLKNARLAVKNRENLRFLRSKSFGISRRIFRNIDTKMHNLELIEQKGDAFYLTYREIFDYIDGRSESFCLKKIAAIRREEFKKYISEDDPPDRFITYGAAGVSLQNSKIIESGDLLKSKVRVSDDPNLVYGTSCCPGIIKGKVRVAATIEEARGLDGEILITKRTDPGWVPLFPSCSGLIVERGSLLSHSAVIARELGIPTIVGVSSDLMKKLKTGDEIELNATIGEIRILND